MIFMITMIIFKMTSNNYEKGEIFNINIRTITITLQV